MAHNSEAWKILNDCVSISNRLRRKPLDLVAALDCLSNPDDPGLTDQDRIGASADWAVHASPSFLDAMCIATFNSMKPGRQAEFIAHIRAGA